MMNKKQRYKEFDDYARIVIGSFFIFDAGLKNEGEAYKNIDKEFAFFFKKNLNIDIPSNMLRNHAFDFAFAPAFGLIRSIPERYIPGFDKFVEKIKPLNKLSESINFLKLTQDQKDNYFVSFMAVTAATIESVPELNEKLFKVFYQGNSDHVDSALYIAGALTYIVAKEIYVNPKEYKNKTDFIKGYTNEFLETLDKAIAYVEKKFPESTKTKQSLDFSYAFENNFNKFLGDIAYAANQLEDKLRKFIERANNDKNYTQGR
jgi:hypothetical protein